MTVFKKDDQQKASPEVRAVPRVFTAKYKLRILAEIDKAEHGQVGAILRRERLHSASISNWRRARDEGALNGVKGARRGRKTDQAGVERQLRAEIAELKERLGTAEELISAQGKVSALLQAMSPKSDKQK